MDFPELLSVILHTDCGDKLEQEFPRLKALANANGSNYGLLSTLSYFNHTKKSPTAEQLKEYVPSLPRMTVDHILVDLDQAAEWQKAYPAGSFELAMSNSWRDANRNYVETGYTVARSIPTGAVPHNIKPYQFEKRMKALYGEDEAGWDRIAYSQLWLSEYLAANPFVAAKAELELQAGEYVVSTVTSVLGDAPVISHLTCINGEDIVPVPIDWWWEDRFALRKIAWLAGLPGTGKTSVMLDVAARITTGRDFPDGAKNVLGPRTVIVAMSEDGLDDTVVPRLIAAGADMKNVKFANRVIGEADDRTPNLQDDMRHLKDLLRANPDTALMIMDPMTNYFGSDVNINVDKEARPIMTALKKLCEEFTIGFMGVIHNNKQNDANAIQKILGCSSIVGAARSVYGCSVDPDDKTKRYFTFIKGNCSAKMTGIEYALGTQLINEKIKTSVIAWGNQTEDTAEDCLKRERDSRYERKEGKQISLAQTFVPFYLKGKGRVPSTAVYTAAEGEGISSGMIKAAVKKFFSANVVHEGPNKGGIPGWTMRWIEEREEKTASEESF